MSNQNNNRNWQSNDVSGKIPKKARYDDHNQPFQPPPPPSPQQHHGTAWNRAEHQPYNGNDYNAGRDIVTSHLHNYNSNNNNNYARAAPHHRDDQNRPGIGRNSSHGYDNRGRDVVPRATHNGGHFPNRFSHSNTQNNARGGGFQNNTTYNHNDGNNSQGGSGGGGSHFNVPSAQDRMRNNEERVDVQNATGAAVATAMEHTNDEATVDTSRQQEPPKEGSYQARLLKQLPEADRNFLPVEEFLPLDWDERKTRAAEVVANAWPMKEDSNDIDEDSDRESGEDSGDDDMQRNFALAHHRHQQKFVKLLPNCLPLTVGFHIVWSTKLEWCFCPCHRIMKPWRKLVGIDDEDFTCASNANGKFQAHGLVAHLRKMTDAYHVLTLQYLEELYKNFYDVPSGGMQVRHKAFYGLNTKEFQQAEGYEKLKKERAMRELSGLIAKERELREELERKNKELSIELQNLKLVSPDEAKKKEEQNKLREKFHLKESRNETVSLKALNALSASYKRSWSYSHKVLGMKPDMPVNKVVFTVGPKIKLQELFDTDYKKAESSGLFCHTDGDVRKTRQCAQRLMLLSQVELSDEKELDLRSSSLKKEIKGLDAGGVSREFFSQVWLQMGGLQVKKGEIVIQLFEEDSEAGCVPVTDAVIEQALKNESDKRKGRILEKINVFYRAIGRLMIHWLATDPLVSFQPFEHPGGMQCGHSIAGTALPAFYRNVLLRGINPTDSDYELGELVDHMLPIFNKSKALNEDNEEKQEILTSFLSSVLSFEGSSEENEATLRNFAHEQWVEGRSIALKGLREGLTIDGLISLDPVLRLAPLTAINQIMFSKPDVSVSDVIDAIDNGNTDIPDDLFEYIGYQESLIVGLKAILTKRSKDDYKQKNPEKANFLGQFVNFCTGLWTIPSRYHGTFKINIDFRSANAEEDFSDDSLPMAHTCICEIVFPARAYGGCHATLEKKLDQSIGYSLGGFSMT